MHGVIRSDEERGLGREAAQVHGDVKRGGDEAIWVRQNWERQTAGEAFLERPMAVNGVATDADDRTARRNEQVVLFLEGQATSLAGGGIVPAVEENQAPCPVEEVESNTLPSSAFNSNAGAG